MNTQRLVEILSDCSLQCRTGPQYVLNGEEATEQQAADLLDPGVATAQGREPVRGGVLEIFDMPHVSDVQKARSDVKIVDMIFVDVAVDTAKAESRRSELVEVLSEYPEMDRLTQGPSYIEIGADIGDQGLALQLMAVGSVLGFWQVMSGLTLGMDRDMARQMAGVGLLNITGYNPEGKAKD